MSLRNCITVPKKDCIRRDIEQELGEQSCKAQNASFDPNIQNPRSNQDPG